MKRSLGLLVAASLPITALRAQEGSPPPPPDAAASATVPPTQPVPAAPSSSPAKRSLFGRVLHPFGGADGEKSDVPPRYKDKKLTGLVVNLELSPQTVKLSEMRQLDVKATLSNKGKKAVELSFSNDQRIEIYLKNAGDAVLTKWSDNHAITDKPGSVLINPGEHIEYNEKISTRELTRDKVFVAEVFFPQYPELRVRQKFLTAP